MVLEPSQTARGNCLDTQVAFSYGSTYYLESLRLVNFKVFDKLHPWGWCTQLTQLLETCPSGSHPLGFPDL